MKDPNNLSGQSIQDYELLERIGVGGFGAVYRAHERIGVGGFGADLRPDEQPPIVREVAIKVILPEYADQPSFIRRFETEAQIVARLEHIHIVPLYKYWHEAGGGAYLVMRLLPGSLGQALREDGPWSAEATARLLDQIGAALMVAHRNGVIHRDIKPDNILLDNEDNAYLADFGLAKVLEKAFSSTQSGRTFGTAAYLSPEQIKGKAITPLVDIYSLGLVLYEMLTGVHPFMSESGDISPHTLYFKHINEPMPPLQDRRPDLPEALNEVLQRATAKRPSHRYPDALSLAVDFRRALASNSDASILSNEDVPERLEPAESANGTTLERALVGAGAKAVAREDRWQGWWWNSMSALVPQVVQTNGKRPALTRGQAILLAILGTTAAAVLLTFIVRPPPQPPPAPLSIQVVANPLAFDWISGVAAAFNSQPNQVNGRLIQVNVTQRDGMDSWRTGVWSASFHPVAWIPESTFILEYANDNGLRYQAVKPSVASTALVWGVFSTRAKILGKPLDWNTFQHAAVKGSWSLLGGPANWGFVKPAFALPCKSTVGFGVLLSAAAGKYQTGQLTTQQVNDPTFLAWLSPVIDAVPNFAPLGQQPAAAMASNGASIADFALLPESEWLIYYSQISNREPIQFSYPNYKVVFDMPLVVWSGPETSADERQAVQQFAAFLMTPANQQHAVEMGLRAATASTSSESPFTRASGAGINPASIPGTSVVAPNRASAETLLNWFKNIRSC